MVALRYWPATQDSHAPFNAVPADPASHTSCCCYFAEIARDALRWICTWAFGVGCTWYAFVLSCFVLIRAWNARKAWHTASFRTCVPCWAGSTLCLIVAYDASRTSNLTLCTCFFSFEMLMFSWRAWKTIRCASLLIHRLRSFEYSFFFFLDEHIHNCSSPKTIHRKDYSSTILQQFTFFLAHTQRASFIKLVDWRFKVPFSEV